MSLKVLQHNLGLDTEPPESFDHDFQNRFLWNYIRRQYTKNNLIYNYSTSRIYDREQSLDQIISAYSPAIIHKK